MPSPKPVEVASAYFAAVAARDLDAAVDLWAPGGLEHVRGQVDTTAPEGVRAFLGGLFAAVPDIEFEVVEMTAQASRVAVRWRARGTFCGAPYQGIAATGARVDLEGIDELRISRGRIVENHAFTDGMTFARQVGLLPPDGSATHARMLTLANARTRATRHLHASGPREIADGVWLVRGGLPKRVMNVYLVRDTDAPRGVLVFDGGIRTMTRAVARAGAGLGGITRLVLGHGHQDHRGIAPGLRVPVFCHPDDVAITEGDGGYSSFSFDELGVPARYTMPFMLRHVWDGGPVEVAGTVEEDDVVAGFRVVHLPGHAAGLIALYRESDGLALTTDCFYTLDPETTIPGPPRVPHPAFNLDTEQARASIRKLAALAPTSAWPGHAKPVTGDVRAQLERAAEA